MSKIAMARTTCVLCDQALAEEPTHTPSDGLLFFCDTCNHYEVDSFSLELGILKEPQTEKNRYKLSAMARTSLRPLVINGRLLAELRAGIPRDRTVPEKIELMIRYVAKRSTQIGEDIQTIPRKDYPAAWCRGPTEWAALIEYASTPAMNLLRVKDPDPADMWIALLVDGWRLVEETKGTDSTKAFIAMAFDPSLDDVKSAIQRAIEGAGYDPLRVDDDHYSGGVMDRIIMHIRDSKFIVADFTMNRGGVYYEAGVAFGLGVGVVNVCDAECLKNEAAPEVRPHFDVRHLVFVSWEKDKLAKFSEDLRTHIIAVHGRGPRPST